MRSKVKIGNSDVALRRVLDAFAQELIDASDEEIVDAARDLGMDLRMRQSAVFQGVTYPAEWRLSDFFDLEALQRTQPAENRITGHSAATPQKSSRRPKRRLLPTDRKPSGK